MGQTGTGSYKGLLDFGHGYVDPAPRKSKRCAPFVLAVFWIASRDFVAFKYEALGLGGSGLSQWHSYGDTFFL